MKYGYSRQPIFRFVVLLAGAIALLSTISAIPVSAQVSPQIDIPVVDKMPDLPSYLTNHPMPDWSKRADAYTSLMLDSNAGISYRDPSGFFSLPPYYKSNLVSSTVNPYAHDSLSTLGTIFSSWLMGGDMKTLLPTIGEYYQQPSPVGNNARVYTSNVNTEKGTNGMSTTGSNADSFWYALLTTYYAYALTMSYGDRYNSGLISNMYACTNRWYECSEDLHYDYSQVHGFDFINNVGITQGGWTEPDAGAGIAWVEYIGYLRFPNTDHYLACAKSNLDALTKLPYNPNYEGPNLCLGALTAARMNAEEGTNYDDAKIVNWVFDNTWDNSKTNPPPYGFKNNIGIRTGSYRDDEVNGLTGGTYTPDYHTRAFSLETMEPLIGLLPMVRYDPRFATAIGKYLLNMATNARLFYSDFVPAHHQEQRGAKAGEMPAIPFESFDQTYTSQGVQYSGFARGDAIDATPQWAASDRSIYGGAAIGILGSTISSTNNPEIPKWDCDKLDFARFCRYPTYLYYNPTAETTAIKYDCGAIHSDLYELTTHKYLKRDVAGAASFDLPPKSGYVVCIVPHAGKIERQNHRLLVNNYIIDYWTDGQQL